MFNCLNSTWIIETRQPFGTKCNLLNKRTKLLTFNYASEIYIVHIHR